MDKSYAGAQWLFWTFSPISSAQSLEYRLFFCRAAPPKTWNYLRTPSSHAKHRPSHPCGLLAFSPSKPTVSAATALTCEVTQRWFEFSFSVMLTPDLFPPQGNEAAGGWLTPSGFQSASWWLVVSLPEHVWRALTESDTKDALRGKEGRHAVIELQHLIWLFFWSYYLRNISP